MHIDNISSSILHVTAQENIDINHDLNSEQLKSIGQLIQENEDTDDKKKENGQTQS